LFIDNFRSKRFQTHIYYASKAFSNLYVLGLVRELGLHLDVVSGGELYTAIDQDLIHKRSQCMVNNKLPEELSMALDHKIGTIIIDHPTEYELLSSIAKQKNQKVRVLLRVNPGIEADTHRYIQLQPKILSSA